MKGRSKSYAKLILLGEYSVLYGGRSIVLPLKYFQESEWKSDIKSNTGFIRIQSFQDQAEKPFFEWKISLSNIGEILNSNSSAEAFFSSCLAEIQNLDKTKIKAGVLQNRFNFDLKFGFGSSSTSIKNLAEIFALDPWQLYFSAVNGSGADLAATFFSPGEIVSYYKEPRQMEQMFPPWEQVLEHSLFVYLGKKVSSEQEVEKIVDGPNKDLISSINQVIEDLCKQSSVFEFIPLLHRHEKLISQINGLDPIQEKLFSDFSGGIKSLGAWGGDFIWALSNQSIEKTKKYFQDKNYHQFYSFQELVR